MKPKPYAILLLLVCLLCIACTARQARIPEPRPPEGPRGIESLEIELGRPSAPEADLAYLGLKGSDESVRMDRIQARVLFVEIFDMYCRFCQAAAPRVNALYRLISRDGQDSEVKVIGIGRMNSGLEVTTFKDKYKVPFPLFPDKELRITRALGADQEGTPHFIVIHMDPPGRGRVVLRKTGAFEDPRAFYEEILEAKEPKKDG